MLEITIPQRELFDELNQEFVEQPQVELVLEHSLFSLSKWESKWEVPFLGDEERTDEQTIDYIRCMTISPKVDPEVYTRLTQDNIDEINDYISAKMTATWFSERPEKKGKKEIITSELIYYWMISLTIPFETEHWHLNRLLTLIRVCNEKNQPSGKKMSKSELASRNRALNAQRRAQLKTNG